MKTTLLFLLFFSATLFSQAKYLRVQTIKVVNNKQQPMANLPIVLIETTTKQRILKKTNDSGVVVFQISSGKEWAVNVLEMKNCSFIEVSDKQTSTGNSLITYDVYNYKRTYGPKVDRKSLNITTIDQTQLKSLQYSQKTALIELVIRKEDGTNLSNFNVNLTCFKEAKTYLGKTNNSGKASFIVPINSKYEIDIDGLDNFDYIDTNASGQYGLEMTYQPTDIKEIVRNDTIIQVLPKEIKGTSSRVAVKLRVNKLGGNDVGKEFIYLQMLGSNKIYKGKIGKEGLVSFLLPNKSKYLIHFKYQKDVDVLNFLHMRGISSSEEDIIYKPNPKLEFPEKFIPTPDQLFLNEFRNFITKQFPEPTSNPIDLHVKWANDSINTLSKEAVLEVGFKIRSSNNNLNGPPINLSLVVDRSGSMEGDDRIGALKKSLLNFVGKLRKTDMVSLVSYDSEAKLLVPSQLVGDGKYLKDMIEDIEAGGGTNIYNGMVMGYEQLGKNQILKGTNRLVLLTDGYGNDDPLITIKKSTTYNDKGIELSAIGVGEDYNQALLSQLASTGGGLLNFIGSSKNIDSVFQKELISLLSPCVSDVNIQIEYNDKIIFKQLYGFPFKKAEGNLVKLKLDAIYPGLQGIGLLKFDLSEPSKEVEKKPIIIRMTYFDPDKLKYDEKIEKIYLKWLPKSGKIELILESEQKKIYAIAILNQGIKVMSENFSRGEFKEAIKTIENTQSNIKEIYPNSQDNDVQKLMDQLNEYSLHLSQLMSNTKDFK